MIDYDDWARIVGDDKWNYAGRLPYFRKTEHHYHHSADSKVHGFEGPIHTTQSRARQYPLAEVVHDAFIRTGAEFNPDANNGHPNGLALYTENWKHSTRQPAGMAYPLAGVMVITEAWAKRIIMGKPSGSDRPAAKGVELHDGRQFMSRREVLVTCGAYRTPQILMLSGIGPAEELEKFHIEPMLKNANVGKHFHDHNTFTQYWRLKHPEKGLAVEHPSWFTKPSFLVGTPTDFLFTASVPVLELKKALAIDEEESILDDHPYLEPSRAHYEAAILYAPAGAKQSSMNIPIDGSLISSCVIGMLTTARGSITLASSDVRDHPVIDPNHLGSEADRTVMRKGTRRVLRAMETPEMQGVVASESCRDGYPPLTSTSSAEDIDARIRHCAYTWWHLGGTAAMGKVVDTDLKVKGCDGLRVVDASIFPAPIAAH